MTISINGINQSVPSREDYGEPVQDITELKTVGPSERSDQQHRYVEDQTRPYYFDLQSVTAESLPDIVEPGDAPAAGRWIRLPAAVGPPAPHATTHKGGGSDEIAAVTGALAGLMTSADKTKLDAIGALANVTSVFGRTGVVVAVANDYDHAELAAIGVNDHHAQLHAVAHVTGGGDKIRNATAALDGLATAAQITKLDAIEALADVTDAANVAAAGALLAAGTVTLTGPWNTGAFDILTKGIQARAAADLLFKSADASTAITISDTEIKIHQNMCPVTTSNIDLGNAGNVWDKIYVNSIVRSSGFTHISIAAGVTTINIAGADLDTVIKGDNDATLGFFNAGVDRFGVGVDPVSIDAKFVVEGTVKLKEQAAAQADTVAYGQYWVRSDTPNVAMFTDDAGTDFVLNAGGGGDLKADGTVPLTSTWSVGTQTISDLAGLLPVDANRSLGSGSKVWQKLYAELIFSPQGVKAVNMWNIFEINADGVDLNFRVRGDTDVSMLTGDAGLDRVGVGVALGAHLAKFHVGGGILGELDVEANTDVAAGPNVIVPLESRRLFTNEGTAAENHHNLPPAAAGLEFKWIVQDADGIQINAVGDDTIRIVGLASAAAGRVESATIGSAIRLVAINATEWVAQYATGSWTVDGTAPGAAVLTDGSVPMTANWDFGGFTLSGLNALHPETDVTRDIGTSTNAWKNLWIRDIQSEFNDRRIDFDGGRTTLNNSGLDINTTIKGLEDDALFTTDAGKDMVGIGIAEAQQAAKLDVSQNVTDAAVPVLRLNQLDVSEPMTHFDCAIGTGQGIEAVVAKALTVTHFIKYSIEGVGEVYVEAGTIA